MNKEIKEKLRQDPVRYEKHLQYRRDAYKRKMERIRNDPNRYENLKRKWRRDRKKLEIETKEEKRNRRKHSPYYQAPAGWQRYKCHIFRRMARCCNRRCKIGTITAQNLWSFAKKQGLRCPISGEKLTAENISLDHILPIIAGGTNTLDNLRLVIRPVNTAKHTMTDAEFLSFCKKIVSYSKRHIAL